MHYSIVQYILHSKTNATLGYRNKIIRLLLRFVTFSRANILFTIVKNIFPYQVQAASAIRCIIAIVQAQSANDENMMAFISNKFSQPFGS